MYLESICQLGNEPTEKMIKMEWGSRVDLLLNTEEIKPITMRRLNWNIEYISCYRDRSAKSGVANQNDFASRFGNAS